MNIGHRKFWRLNASQYLQQPYEYKQSYAGSRGRVPMTRHQWRRDPNPKDKQLFHPKLIWAVGGVLITSAGVPFELFKGSCC